MQLSWQNPSSASATGVEQGMSQVGDISNKLVVARGSNMQNEVFIGCYQGGVRGKVQQRLLHIEIQASGNGRGKFFFCPHGVFAVVP